MGLARDVLIPDPLQSDRQYARFCHLDLPDLENSEVQDELWALRPLLWGLTADHWLRGRILALEEELRRRGATRYEPSRRPKPKSAEGVKL